MKRVMCLWFPEWPLQRRYAAHPADKSRSIVLHAPAAGGKTRVIACSRSARQRGVLPGMVLAEAQSLWPSSASKAVRFEPHDPRADRQGLRELAAWCQQFSPLVAIDTAEPPDSLLLDAGACEYGFGGEEEFADKAVNALERHGYRAVAAVADTIGAAWAVGHFGMLKRRVLIVPLGRQTDFLRPLPVESLRLPAGILQALQELNVFRVDQLLALPRAGLMSRFGEELLPCIDRALGTLPEVLTPERIDEPLEATWEFEFPTTNSRQLIEVIEYLVDWVLAKISLGQDGVQRLLCSLGQAREEPLRFSVELLRPTVAKRTLMDLVKLKMERLRLPGEVTRVTVRAALVVPLAFHQDELFGGCLGTSDAKEVGELIERLSSRLGEKAVLRPRLRADAQPEFVYAYEPWLMNRERASHASQPAETIRPTFLKSRPLPILVSTNPDGSPTQIHASDIHQAIERSWGPERIETGWWRGDDVRRDYYLAETETGERFWLFHDLTSESWFLHGIFG
ncbi:MAG: DNA polymerase Y family protein [Planctomycetes bacterium]|nr:DNA polymerase Y family protein [Planctomycetota bacterium]